MMRALVILAVAGLTGCASIEYAGTSSLSVQPVEIGGQPRCCAVTVHDGKQYASVDVLLEKTGDDYRLKLSARGVEAFRGQEIAAGATQSLASTSAKAAAVAAIAPAALPAVGAVLASPGLGAAAAGAGAGALAVGQELGR